MFFQVAQDMIDLREYANSEQPRFFGQSAADFFGMQAIPIDWEGVPATQVQLEQSQSPRTEVVESLQRSLTQHRDVWAELAHC